MAETGKAFNMAAARACLALILMGAAEVCAVERSHSPTSKKKPTDSKVHLYHDLEKAEPEPGSLAGKPEALVKLPLKCDKCLGQMTGKFRETLWENNPTSVNNENMWCSKDASGCDGVCVSLAKNDNEDSSKSITKLVEKGKGASIGCPEGHKLELLKPPAKCKDSCEGGEPNDDPSKGESDPHMVFGDGGMADFRGSHDGIYSMLSARGLQMAILFEEVDFNQPMGKDPSKPMQLVHGSFMMEAYWTVRTSRGHVVHVSTHADRPGCALVVVHNTPSHLTQWTEFKVGDVKVSTRMVSTIVETPGWQMNVTSRQIYGAGYVEPRKRLDVYIRPLAQPGSDGVFPHGILGQSYDGDGYAAFGKVDNYDAKEVWTTAEAEGAIEGVAKDYLLESPYTVHHKFSRFDMRTAGPRNLEGLNLTKIHKHLRLEEQVASAVEM